MAHQNTDHCVWNCLESVRGVPYELSNNTAELYGDIIDILYMHTMYMYGEMRYKKCYND